MRRTLTVEQQRSTRIPLLLHLFPGLTRKEFGRLTYDEWCDVRDMADEWKAARADG